MKWASIAMMLLAASLQLGAQGKDIEYLKTLIEGRRVSFDYLLTPEVKQISKLEGKVLIDGECYHIWGNQLEIICDGVTKWSVDQAAKRVSCKPFIMGKEGQGPEGQRQYRHRQLDRRYGGPLFHLQIQFYQQRPAQRYHERI